MRVLVTGATGYVGRPLVGRLLRDAHDVVALARDGTRARDLADLGVAVVEGDVRRAAEVLPPKLDAVVHLAFSLFPASDAATNLEGSRRVIEAAAARGVRRFVFVSSSLVYGPSRPDRPVTESDPCRPHLRFARQQLAVEEALRSRARAAGFPAAILRPSQVIGGRGGSFEKVVGLLKRGGIPVAGDGSQGVAFTELDDLHDAIVRCLDADLAPGETINIGTPVNVPVGPLYDRLASAWGGPRPRRIPRPALLALGAVTGAAFRLARRTPPFDLDVARLSCMVCGPRSVDRAGRLIGFSPRNADPWSVLGRYLPAAARAAAC